MQSIARTIRNAVLIALVLVLAWLAIEALLSIFAGILLAIFLRGLADVIQRCSGKAGIHLRIGLSLLLVIVGILIILAAIGWFFNDKIDSQIAQLSQDLPNAFYNFEDKLRRWYWGRLLLNKLTPSRIVGDGGAATNIAGEMASTVFGVARVTIAAIGGVVVSLIVGLYCAAEPGLYARGIVSLVSPERRDRADQILRQTADTLWYWEMGRLFSMTVIGVVTGCGLWLIGVPLPAALGLLAGILTFIP
jgi:predicted PurR-regulated permease PerM